MHVKRHVSCRPASKMFGPPFSEFYEPNALMMEEEGAVIAGLLVGLNVIDANLCMKGEDLDSQVLSYFIEHL